MSNWLDVAAPRDDSAAVRPPLLRPRHPVAHTLCELLDTFGGQRVDVPLASRTDTDTVMITGISAASLDVSPGDLFIALPGAREHGARFSRDAAARGAVAVVTDAHGAMLAARAGLPTVVMDALRPQLAALSAWTYRSSGRMPTLLGVTGTNGKTSTTYIIEAILDALGVPTGVSTTVERRIGTSSVPSRLTTPEAPELHALLARMREEGAQAAALEVSAHGVSRGRVDGVMFDVVGFTNLSHDHLDEYRDMNDYLAAKAALFQPGHAHAGIVSLDSKHGRRLVQRARIPVETISSRPDVPADWTVSIIDEQLRSTAFTLTAPDGRSVTTRVTLMGRHMAANAGLAIAMLVTAGVSLEEIDRAVGSGGIRVDVPGRSERVSGEQGPLVLVDFSHNGGAFETTLQALRRVTPGTLIMVMGADGEKDATKREHMGYLSAANADVLIVTDHHPRHENPDAIRAALTRGARRAGTGATLYDIPQPAVAIRKAISLAGPDDAILWAGPGSSDYRLVGGYRVPYSPRHDARAALAEAGWA